MATEKTLADLLNITFRDNQADGSITASDMRDLIASVPYLTALGWEFRYDSQYTEGSPLTLVDATPQKISLTQQPGQDLRYPSTFPEIWNFTDQKLDISNFLNGFGIVRFAFRGSYTGGQPPHIDFWVDAGSDPLAPAGGGTSSNIIFEDSCVFAKGGGEIQAFNLIMPLFGGADFATNGAQFIIQSHGGNCDIWEIAITAGATFVPNPAGEG